MNKLTTQLAVVLLLCFSSSCTIKPKNLTLEKDNIRDAYWVLVSVEGQNVQAPNNTRTAYIRFEEKESDVSGFTGCNKLSGSYSINGQRLQLSELSTTRMACTETETENKLVDVLRRVNLYRISGDVLTLFEGDKAVATFMTGNPAKARDVEDNLHFEIRE